MKSSAYPRRSIGLVGLFKRNSFNTNTEGTCSEYYEKMKDFYSAKDEKIRIVTVLVVLHFMSASSLVGIKRIVLKSKNKNMVIFRDLTPAFSVCGRERHILKLIMT